jgi:hypothetical protein
MMRSDPQKAWTAKEAGSKLYANADGISLLMRDLKDKRILATPGNDQTYVYRPESIDVSRMIDSLAELYREWRVAVITAVYSKPIDRIQSFADSFRLRKEK